MAEQSGVRAEALGVQEEEFQVASQWRLMWWRFKKHRAASISGIVVLILYFVTMNGEFISTNDVKNSNKDYIFLPPQPVRYFDNGRFSPHVNEVNGVRDMTTFQMVYTINPEKKIPLKFFTKGYKYKWMGIIPTDIHFIGIEETGSRDAIYFWGGDNLGRDLFSRMVLSARISMTIGLLGIGIGLVMGIVIGGISGYYGGIIDIAIQRFGEFIGGIPTLPLWIALSASLPLTWSIVKVYFALVLILSIFGSLSGSRAVRSKFLSLREEDYVMAARLVGASDGRIMFRHMLPGFMSHLIATTSLSIPGMILGETALSFLGLGLRPPAVSWGVLLQQAQNIQTIALFPWLMMPAMAVIVVVLSFNFFGDGLRDAADPYGK